MKKLFIVIFVLLNASYTAVAQQWTSYTNFNNVSQMTFQAGGNIIWGATPGGIFSFSSADTVLIKHYTNVDGLPYIEASSIVLDNGQNKWIGTLGGGLARLDSAGINFSVYTSNDGLASDTLLCVAASDHYIFTGGFGCLSCYDISNDTWSIPLTSGQGFPLGSVTQALAARNDSLWIATDQGLQIVINTSSFSVIRTLGNWMTFGSYDGLTSDIRCILLTDTLSMIGAANGAAKLVGGTWQKIPGLSNQIRSIAQIGDSIFFATNDGVKLWYQNILSDISTGLLSYNVYSLLVDGDRNIWAGSDSGLNCQAGASWRSFPFDCMRDNNIKDMAVGSGGMVWLAHPQSGVSYNRNNSWNYLNLSNTGLPINQPSNIAVTDDKSLWVGTWGSGLFVRRPDSLWTAYYSPAPLPTPFIGQILPALNGVYLINYDLPDGVDAISFFSKVDSSWHYLYAPTNKFYPTCIAIDNVQNLWIGSYYNGLYRISPEGTWSNWSPTSGFSSNHVYSLCSGPNGTLWIGTENGLFAYDGNNFTNYNFSNSPILSDNVFSVTFDRSDNLWIGTQNGLNCLSWKGQWTSYSSDPSSPYYSKLISNSIIKVLAFPDNTAGDDIYIATSKGLSVLKYDASAQPPLDKSYVAPNPFNMAKDEYIYFSDLPSEARIDIYTLDGRVCGTFYGPAVPAHTLSVRPKKDFFRQPASGIYLCRISSKERKTYICKLVILR